MSLWLALGAMTLFAVALIGLPLLRSSSKAASRRGFDLAVYRAQLDEIAREQERGLLAPEEAAAARLEVERRMLAADQADPEASHRRSGAIRHSYAALALVVGFLALSGGLYWQLGSPDVPSQPFAERTVQAPAVAGDPGSDTATAPQAETLMARLEERVAANPEDLEGWIGLGRAYILSQQFEQAADAYRRAVALGPEIAALHATLGEILVMTSRGTVTEAARDSFERALALDPAEQRSRFYEGLWQVQRGELEPALGTWTALLADAPPDAPWRTDLQDRVIALAGELGQDPPEIASTAQVEQTPEALRQEAEALAAQLETSPRNVQGWLRLASLRSTLGEPGLARDALERGSAEFEGAPFVQQQFQAAAAQLGIALDGAPGSTAMRGPTADQVEAAQDMAPDEQAAMIREMVSGLAARLEDTPDDIEGWRMLARSYRVLGETEKSTDAYQHVASVLPDDLDAQLDYAEALLESAPDDQPPSPALTEQMGKVLELDPQNPGGLFFMGQVAAQAGDAGAAREHWQRLLAQMPTDAPERVQLERMIDQLPSE